MTLGERLKQLRGDTTQRAIAKATGLSISYLSDIERDRTEPPLRTLAKIARAYKTNVSALLAPVDFDGVEDAEIDPLPFDNVDHTLFGLTRHPSGWYGLDID